MSHNGFVSFVSSGPGDPELLTLKAVDRIKNAEVILYDDLSSGDILNFASADADLIGVGKRAKQNSPKQEHINDLLVQYANSGAKTVRLKSGDAGIFGRLEEELTALYAHGIEFEIIPGVPSAIAAAAHAKISLTRRIEARRLQFITGHDVHGGLPSDINLASLLDPNTVTAIFMGKRTFPELAKKLINAGLSPQTPALLAEDVSKADESIEFTTVETLAKTLTHVAGDAPAMIIMGPLFRP